MPFWKRTKDGLHEISSGEIDFTKQSLIFFPSFITYENHNSDATEVYTGLFEQYLGGPEIHANANIYAYSYNRTLRFPKSIEDARLPELMSSKLPDILLQKYFPGRRAPKEVRQFADAVIIPAITTGGVFSGTDHAAAKAVCEKLKNITLVSNSYGSAFVTLLDKYLYERLQKEGFSEPDTKLILKSVVHIAACNAMVDKGREGFSTINFEARNDELRAVAQRENKRSRQYVEMKDDNKTYFHSSPENLTVSFISPIGSKRPGITEDAPRLRNYIARRHAGHHAASAESILLMHPRKGSILHTPRKWDGHDLMGYINAWPFQEGHSDIFVRALQNAMSRNEWESKLVDPMQLVKTHPVMLAAQPLSASGANTGYVDKLVKEIEQRSDRAVSR